jgi:hypothetical protein
VTDGRKKITEEDLEPGDQKEVFSPLDWCLAAGCGCGGCLDPTGCSNAVSQGCLGCLHRILVHLGCSIFAVAGLIALGVFIFTRFH